MRSRVRISVRYLLEVAGIFVVYLLTARLGLRTDAVSGFAALVWPPSGIALFAVWVFGYRIWPGVALGALAAIWSIGAPLPSAAGIAVGNTLEAVLGVYLLRRTSFDSSLARLRDVAGLVLLATIAATVVSATIGVFSLGVTNVLPSSALLSVWVAWWVGDALGVLVVGALLLVWVTAPRPRLGGRRSLEAAALAVTTVVITLVVFYDLLGPTPGGVFRRGYLLFPFVTWAAVRFRQHGAVTAIFLVSAIAILGTALGRGPLMLPSLSARLLLVDAFIGITALTALVLGAAVAERDRAQEAAEARQREAAFLAEAARLLGASLDYAATLQSVARHSVPVLGDSCIVSVVEPDGTLRQVAEASRDPAQEALLRRMRGQHAKATALQVVRSGQTLFVSGPDGARLGRSSVSVPLVARGKAIGVITFAIEEPGRSHRPSDLALAQTLAHRCATALDNARLYETAQEAIRARDEFLSVASHELRTPLTTLQLQVSILERAAQQSAGALSPEMVLAKLWVIERQVTRLGGLLDNLLDVSRAVAGRFVLEPAETDLHSVVLEVAERFREQLARSGTQLVVDAAGPCLGLWDQLRLEQIVTNLLANAAKYGSGKPVELRLRCRDQHALLVVEDRGIGISREDQARIFERFERAVSSRHFGGLGLGLWIVRQIVEAMGGTITVKSQPGRGSTFTVLLPTGPSPTPRPSPPLLH